MFKNLKLLSAAAAFAGGLAMMTGGAQAQQLIENWDFNLSLANGGAFSGLVDQTGIDDVDIAGESTITQTLLNGNPDGQVFEDNGQLTWTSYDPNGGGAPVSLLGLGDQGSFVYIDFAGLTGVFEDPNNTPGDGDEFITFDPGAGTIRLILDDTDDIAGNNANELVLATFEIIAPSGGSDIDFFGGAAATATIDVTLEIVSQLNNGTDFLFEDENGDPLTSPFRIALVNVNALINSGPTSCVPDVNGFCDSILGVDNGGQFNLAQVPEPATLGLMGAGLVVLGAVARRRRKAA